MVQRTDGGIQEWNVQGHALATLEARHRAKTNKTITQYRNLKHRPQHKRNEEKFENTKRVIRIRQSKKNRYTMPKRKRKTGQTTIYKTYT